MLRWGYPYVMQEFKFHMTLTGSLSHDTIDDMEERANTIFRDFLGKALSINSLALLGEGEDSGRFHVLANLSLGK